MLHHGPNVNSSATGGFIDIASAENLRQSVTRDEFKARYPTEYEAAIKAAIGLREARQRHEEALGKVRSLATPISAGDLADAIERDAMELLKNPPAPPHETVRRTAAPTGVDSRARQGKRKATVKASPENGSTETLLETDESVPLNS